MTQQRSADVLAGMYSKCSFLGREWWGRDHPYAALKIAWNCSGMNRGICSHQFPPLGGSPLIGRTLALCSPGFGREIFGSHWIFCFILWELGREGDATRVLAQKTRSRSLRSNPVASSFLAPGCVGRCLFWTHCTWTQSGRTETFFLGFWTQVYVL